MRYDPDISIIECPYVYPPKEDTFLLLKNIDVGPGEPVLEMGCGTGLITCHLAKAGASVTSVDINPLAIECTRSNLTRNGLRSNLLVSDLFSMVGGRFDQIIFNPPYLSVEEEGALEKAWSGGTDGVRVLERFLVQVREHVRPGGRVLLLLSSEMSTTSLSSVLSSFRREKIASERYFFEELWVERLNLCQL